MEEIVDNFVFMFQMFEIVCMVDENDEKKYVRNRVAGLQRVPPREKGLQ